MRRRVPQGKIGRVPRVPAEPVTAFLQHRRDAVRFPRDRRERGARAGGAGHARVRRARLERGADTGRGRRVGRTVPRRFRPPDSRHDLRRTALAGDFVLYLPAPVRAFGTLFGARRVPPPQKTGKRCRNATVKKTVTRFSGGK